MGKIISHQTSNASSLTQINTLMIGMSNSGKTSILYKLKQGQIKQTTQTTGFNLETLITPKAKFIIWDVGGYNLQGIWKHYLVNRDLVIYVIDGSDQSLFQKCRQSLSKLDELQQLKQVPFLIVSSKSDLRQYVKNETIISKLKLNDLNHLWKLISFSIFSSEQQNSSLLQQALNIYLISRNTKISK